MACRWISQKSAKLLLGISIFILFIAVGVTVFFGRLYDIVLKKYITLEKGSLVTSIWEDIPLPIYEKLYFFNITNEENFLRGREPLNVTEVGPYTYKAKWVKKNPQWNSNHTVSYRETRTYHFVPELSVGSEEDIVNTLNGPMIIGANTVSESVRIFFDFYCLMRGEKVVIQRSIRELAYNGYADPIMKKAVILKPELPYKDGRFSWLYGKNASDDGLFTVFTGIDDETRTDFINNWNGKENLSFWKSESCNKLNGTSIETGPPIKGHQDSYSFFQSFFCRSLSFNFTEDVEHFAITAKRFKPFSHLFANSTENPENHCFEVNKEYASGVLNIGPCQFGAPVFLSFPHFYLADSSFMNSVNGLNASEDKHGSHIDVEPITGVSIDITVRFQINLEIQKLKDFYFFDNVTKGVFPVFWAELSLKIDEDLASFLKRSVRDPKYIAYSVLAVVLLMGLIGVLVSAFVLFANRMEDDDELIIAKDTNTLGGSKCCSFKSNNKVSPEETGKIVRPIESTTADFPSEDSTMLEKCSDLSAESEE